MSKKLLTALTAILLVGAMAIGASAASASQRLWYNSTFTELAASESANVFGANFSMETSSAVLKVPAAGLTITCTSSTLGGTVKTNTTTALELLVQSVVFGQCKDNTGAKVTVLTKTTTPWAFNWSSANTFALTGISAQITDGATVCTVGNASSAFHGTWANSATHSTVAISEQSVALSGTSCALAGDPATETVTYKMQEASGPNDNLWLN